MPHPDVPPIRCADLTKIFKDFWGRPSVRAVEKLNLLVEPKEVFGLLGPNGSGKSTTIKMMLGLLFPTAGQVSLYDRLPQDPEVKRRIGYLPEESYLYRFLTPRETLIYFARIFGIERRVRIARTEMLLEMVGLEAVQHRAVGEFSKGMQRRVGLASALINDPDLLILDEPTTGLDPLGTRQIKDLILQLKARGKTVLLCSHLLADVEDVCDRISILYGGKVQALGTVASLLEKRNTLVLETQTASPEQIEKLKSLIAAAGIDDRVAVHTGQKRLERLFLEIVERAQQAGISTSGAQGQRAVATFLTERSASKAAVSSDNGAAVLSELLKEEPLKSARQIDSQIIETAQTPEAEVLNALTANEPQADRSAMVDSMDRGTVAKDGTSGIEHPKPRWQQEADRSLLSDLSGDR